MNNFIDCTTTYLENDLRNLISQPGRYKVRFISYTNDDGYVDKVVDVVYVTPKTSRMLVIIVKIDDTTYQDFYYNENSECFKILTFNDYNADDIDDEDLLEAIGGIDNVGTFEASWIVEDVKAECPIDLAKYRVDYDTVMTHNFFKDMV